MPKGTEIEVVAHFDNSPQNKFNPDPTKDVRWGDQTWEEMMIGFWGTVAERQPNNNMITRRSFLSLAGASALASPVIARSAPRQSAAPAIDAARLRNRLERLSYHGRPPAARSPTA